MSWKSQLLLLSLVVCVTSGLADRGFGQAAEAPQKPATADEQLKPAAADQQLKPAVADQQLKPSVADQQDNSESTEDPFGEMSLEELGKDYSVKIRAYSKRYMAAPTKAEKREIFKTIPNVKPYWPRLIELINEAEGSKAGLEVIDWWYRRGGRRQGSDVIARLLLKNYSQKETINKYIYQFALHLPKEEAERELRSLVKNSPFEAVQGTASYHLLGVLTKRADELEGEAADAAVAEAKKLRDSIYAKYPNAADSTGAKYTALLDAIDFADNLKIGQPVPNIIGVDLNGEKFKLSDYDGKVRVISFWGDW